MCGEYKVYVHVNKVNRKIYIGQTKQTLEQRYKNGYEHCRHFWNAIQKYGWENFEHIILFENLSLDMANIIEEELIKKYNSTHRDNGYNMKSGGLNHIPSDETRKLLSESHKGERHWNYGRHWGDDYKTKLREIHTGRIIKAEWKEKMSQSKKGKKISEKHKESISKSKMGDKNPMYGKHLSEKAKKLRKERSKHVLQYSLDGIFIKEWSSSSDIAKEYNIDTSNIVRCCIGETNSCCGFMWQYMTDDKIPEKIISYEEKGREIIRKSKKVYQYSIEGYYLKEFKSANEIKELLDADVNCIRGCCLGKLKSYLGYRWSYECIDKLPPIDYKTTAIPIIQFDKNLKYIKEWKSATEIKKELGIDPSSISKCCRGKQETSGGYRWKYKSDCKQ